MENTNPELEQFRKQWRAEVSARNQNGPKKNSQAAIITPRPPPISRLSSSTIKAPIKEEEDEDNEVAPKIFTSYDGTADKEKQGESVESVSKEPHSALEHYEKAVEREIQGSLGDSLNLYRKAFRMDHQVDSKYKNKHFPPSSFASKPPNPNPSTASATVPNPAHHSLDGPPQSMKQLLASFGGLSIEPAPPMIEGTPAPPCPIAELPEELLVHILKDVAILDVSDFVRLAQVCKRLAYLVSAEEQIWKRVCLGSKVGFGAMHYQWQREVMGGELKDDTLDLEPSDDQPREPLSREAITDALLVGAYSSSWLAMFRLRPRMRFNGVYISTVNYIRPGQASASQITWHSPVHIVTYYRYLRLFRDGTVISLCTTDKPDVVVHHLTKELQELHRGGAASHLESITMKDAHRGRWRLTSPEDDPDADLKDAEGTLFVETEGANARYMYRMKLALRTAGKGAKNNKLAWEGFWNYNLLTDDTGEFPMSENKSKAFIFSRVKSYGDGA